MISVRAMTRDEVARVGEVDRTEHVSVCYTVRDGELASYLKDWDIPRWPADGDWGVRKRVIKLQALIDSGGVVLGAFDGEALAGFAAVRLGLTETMAQLYYFFVDNGHRRKGIGTLMFRDICRLAKESGAEALYISATPSESAVGFYQRQGAVPTNDPHPELLALEPDDIHMILAL